MNEFHRITLHDAVSITDPKLMLVDQQPVRRRFAFEQRYRSFNTPYPPHQRTGEESNDSEVSDQKCDVMFFPGPARESRDGEAGREKKEPDIEPGRTIDIGARNLGVEARLVNRAGDRADNQDGEKHDRELERREKPEDRIALPAGA